jgi:hypothetical protein
MQGQGVLDLGKMLKPAIPSQLSNPKRLALACKHLIPMCYALAHGYKVFACKGKAFWIRKLGWDSGFQHLPKVI